MYPQISLFLLHTEELESQLVDFQDYNSELQELLHINAQLLDVCKSPDLVLQSLLVFYPHKVTTKKIELIVGLDSWIF